MIGWPSRWEPEARDLASDLVILDLTLPRLDGVELFRMLRRESEVPIIMLTAREAYVDGIMGLDSGADDYIVKPYDPVEVIARTCSAANWLMYPRSVRLNVSTRTRTGSVVPRRIRRYSRDRQSCRSRNRAAVVLPLPAAPRISRNPGRVSSSMASCSAVGVTSRKVRNYAARCSCRQGRVDLQVWRCRNSA